tara:strand:+ start:220 stop:465 length:246 start_codon:yes stop_codon:yes gene_type:complete
MIYRASFAAWPLAGFGETAHEVAISMNVPENLMPEGTLFEQPRGGTPEADVNTAPSHHSPFFKLGTEAMVVGAMALMKPIS